MKNLRKPLLALALLAAVAALLPLVAGAAVLVKDTFADGNSTVQNLANNSIRIFKGRAATTRTDAVGSVTFDMTATGSNSEAFWGYFTNPGAPVQLAVGDKLSVSGTFSLTGFVGGGQDIRFGVFNSLGTRNANDLTGGQNDATFAGDPGYALGFFPSGTGSPFVLYRRTNLNVNNVFNTFGDFTAISPGAGATARQTLANGTPYTLTYTIERLSANDSKISVAVTGAGLNNLNFTATESSTTPNTAFDYFAFRVGGASFAQKVAFTDWTVDYTPSLPVITSQPQPSNLTVQVGSNVTTSVAATGNSLSYQWRKDGAPVAGNPSASTQTLNLTNVQLSDAGSYTAVVSRMQAASFAPSNFASNVDVDAPLYINFNQAPKAGTAGRLRVFKEDGTLVDTIDMGVATQQRTNGSVTFNYRPVIVTGNTAAVYLHQKLAYGQSYYVTMEPGVITDAVGAPFGGVSDSAVWNFSTKTSGPAAGASALTVAADGTGDFATVQGAVDFVPVNNTKRVVILVRKGTYTEIVYVQSNKPFITVRGEDRNASVIQYANNNNFNPTSTTHRAAFGVDAADFTLENITLRNTTPQGGSQAEAFRGNNNRIVLNRVSLYSYQDTLLLQGQSNAGGFITDSYIEGDVDFMWGSGAVFFQNSELKQLRTDGFFTQIRNGAGRNGYVYVNCKFTRGAGVGTSYLTRIDPDDFPFSQVVVINSQMDGIRPDPWRFDNPTSAVTAANYPNIRFWEYNSRDLNGNPVDVSQRHPISRQLTAAEAAQWSDPAFVLGNWAPQTKLTAAVTLSNLAQNSTGSPAAVAVTTEPAGLPVTVTYNNSPVPPSAIGSYAVVAAVNHPDYQGTATGTLVVDRTPVAVTLTNLAHTFDGTPKAATAKTTPAGPAVAVTYNGSATPPSAAGTYSVVATVNDPNYRGGTSATMTIYAPGAQPLAAFPGAEGAGANSKGGRGGDVYHVTNLNDSGAGSLREGIRTAAGPRTIVFDVAGTINLVTRLNINKSFLTIAGQTAPGDGVTLAGHSAVITGNNIVIRYLRFRMGDLNCPAVQDDAVWVDKSTDVVLDHVSASWSVDETLSVTESNRVTVQWSFITESMKNSCHEKGAHGYGSLIRYGTGQVTYHHNLYAHHDSRNPRVGDNIGLDFVNNVIYDWGGEASYSGPDSEGSPRVNYVGNYLVAGPMTTSSKLRAFSGGGAGTTIYQSNNLLDGDKDGARDGADNGWAMFINSYTKREPARFDFAQVTTHDAATAYDLVLKTAGHSLKRDPVDERVVGEVKSETGGHINSQNEVGGYPVLNTGAAQTDSDGDGIPDVWETSHGLNPTDATDGRAVAAGGYTNLELYLNDLVPAPGSDPTADTVAPVTAAALSREPNAEGWHNADVTVTLAAADNAGGSGLHEIIYSVNGATHHVHGTPAGIPVNAEGATVITFYAKDKAGNTEAPQTVTVKLDKTAPVVADVTRTPANDAGWNNADVLAGYTASDSLSGLGSPAQGGHTFTAEGAGQSHTFTVEDLAGNVASASIADVNIDKTAPALSAARQTPANANGWNNADVTVGYTAADAGSGLATPAAAQHTFTAEGADQSQTFTVADLAGNTASASIGGVNIDKTLPTLPGTIIADPASAAGAGVSFSQLIADALSGVETASCNPASGALFPAGQQTSVACQVTDKAGNVLAGSFLVYVGAYGVAEAAAPLQASADAPPVPLTVETPTGESLSLALDFGRVETPGVVTVKPIADPAQLGETPAGFSVSNLVAYEIDTTARENAGDATPTFRQGVRLAFDVPGPISEQEFGALSILHREQTGVDASGNPAYGLVDITSGRAYDAATQSGKIYAVTHSFSPFYLAKKVGLKVAPLFDRARDYNAGSTVPVRLQVLDAATGANASSSGLALAVRGLTPAAGGNLLAASDAGGANAGGLFRFVGSSDGGSYLYNLSTKGLAPGRYTLSFYVGNDRSFFRSIQFDVR
ncbi:MAG TPA: pectinesterase family protein [Pyrinomonadaceae bacterium]|nr:pectinesterase family protein [Pyrinomonadaceae bacterium]